MKRYKPASGTPKKKPTPFPGSSADMKRGKGRPVGRPKLDKPVGRPKLDKLIGGPKLDTKGGGKRKRISADKVKGRINLGGSNVGKKGVIGTVGGKDVVGNRNKKSPTPFPGSPPRDKGKGKGKGKVAPPTIDKGKGKGKGKVAPPTIDTGKPGRRKPVPLPISPKRGIKKPFKGKLLDDKGRRVTGKKVPFK